MSRRAAWHGDGWWVAASWRHSPNVGTRPPGVEPTLAIVHSISLPPGVYRGDAVERLFTNRLDWEAHPYYGSIRGLQVSAHFFVRHSGRVLQFAATGARAWHAGVSSWRGRPNCNDWSVGVELEGLEGGAFEAAQYAALARLLAALARRHPLREVVGHEDVAPGRKADPGPGFDWLALARRLHGTGLWLPRAAEGHPRFGGQSGKVLVSH
ncbi:MAG: 1,6-anhydro-N-acetylmuramyl-L-alanine amidase AmpD [Rubrivivax sp.]